MAGTMRWQEAFAEMVQAVSMESGLDGRNNLPTGGDHGVGPGLGLNGVRPRWPEQLPR